jgi:lysine 6-dehydrogenase
MRILVLGYGNIGSVVAADLAKSLPSAEVVIAGRNESRAKEAAAAIKNGTVTGIRLDAQDYRRSVDAAREFDLVVGTLPGDIGYASVKAAIDAKVNMVDVSFMPENPLALHGDALRAGVTVNPDCGVAPGISNLLVGHAISQLDQVEKVCIMVGGLPEKPVPPLDYVITWSAEDLIDEYTRKVKIVDKGKIREVEALTGIEPVEFPGIGRLESFYTDGLRTLIDTVKDVKTMWEKTLRYPGHAEKIRVLKTLGFFDEHPIEIEDTHLPPRKLTVKLLEKTIRRRKVKDILAMRVEVTGRAEETEKHYVYSLLDCYDPTCGMTAMARTTAYPASIVAQLVAQNVIEEKGVVPLERLGNNERIFRKILAELEKRRVKIVENLY